MTMDQEEPRSDTRSDTENHRWLMQFLIEKRLYFHITELKKIPFSKIMDPVL